MTTLSEKERLIFLTELVNQYENGNYLLEPELEEEFLKNRKSTEWKKLKNRFQNLKIKLKQHYEVISTFQKDSEPLAKGEYRKKKHHIPVYFEYYQEPYTFFEKNSRFLRLLQRPINTDNLSKTVCWKNNNCTLVSLHDAGFLPLDLKESLEKLWSIDSIDFDGTTLKEKMIVINSLHQQMRPNEILYSIVGIPLETIESVLLRCLDEGNISFLGYTRIYELPRLNNGHTVSVFKEEGQLKVIDRNMRGNAVRFPFSRHIQKELNSRWPMNSDFSQLPATIQFELIFRYGESLTDY
jgi:hypothetical protein